MLIRPLLTTFGIRRLLAAMLAVLVFVFMQFMSHTAQSNKVV